MCAPQHLNVDCDDTAILTDQLFDAVEQLAIRKHVIAVELHRFLHQFSELEILGIGIEVPAAAMRVAYDLVETAIQKKLS